MLLARWVTASPPPNDGGYGSPPSPRRLAERDRAYLLVPRIEIVARSCCRCGHVVVGARAMRPAATARETFAALAAFETARTAIDLPLRSGDERRQAVDAGIIRDRRLRLWLRLGLELGLRTMFARLMLLFARLIRLGFSLVIAPGGVRRHERPAA